VSPVKVPKSRTIHRGAVDSARAGEGINWVCLSYPNLHVPRQLASNVNIFGGFFTQGFINSLSKDDIY